MNPPEYGTPSEETSVTVPGQYDTAMYSFVKNHQHNLQRIKQNVLMEIQVIGMYGHISDFPCVGTNFR